MHYLQAQEIVLANLRPDEVRATYDTFHQAHLADITPLIKSSTNSSTGFKGNTE
jgi:hypothetical protein